MIVALPPKTLSPADKAKLTKKGYVVIEIDDPEKVRIINIESPKATNDMMMSMLHALTSIGADHYGFVKELYRRLKTQEQIEQPTNHHP